MRFNKVGELYVEFMFKKNKIAPVHIYNHPETAIAFLSFVDRQHDRGRGWEAHIHDLEASDNLGAAARFGHVQQTLETKGYHCGRHVDENGLTTLRVREIGSRESFLSVVRELGLAKGVRHALEMAPDRFRDALSSVKRAVNYVKENPGQGLGFFYIIGDVLSMMMGLGEKRKNTSSADGEDTQRSDFQGADTALDDKKETEEGRYNPIAIRKSIAGVGYTLMSILMLTFAKEGKAAVVDDLVQGMNHAMAEGADLANANLETLTDSQNPIIHFLKKHTIGTAVTIQVLSKLLFMDSARIRFQQLAKEGMTWDEYRQLQGKSEAEILARQDEINAERPEGEQVDLLALMKEFRGGLFDTIGGSSSILGWSMVAMPNVNNGIASVFTVLSSVMNIAGGADLQNPYQMAADGVFLLGDAMIFAIGKGDPGQAVSESVSQYLNALSPRIFSPEDQEHIVQMAARHYAAEVLEYEHKEAKKAYDKPSEAALKDAEERLAQRIREHLAQTPGRYEQLIEASAQIVVRYPERGQGDSALSMRDEAQGALLDYLEGLPFSVHVPRERLVADIQARVNELASQGRPAGMVNFADLMEPAAALLNIIPGGTHPQEVVDLQSALVGAGARPIAAGEMRLLDAQEKQLAQAAQGRMPDLSIAGAARGMA